MNRKQFSDAPQLDPALARVHLLPVPLEQTVSYVGGTKLGPAAILEASYQLENYDREFDCEPGPEYGIFTHPDHSCPADAEMAMKSIEEAVKATFQPRVFFGCLGGEHSITAPIVRALCAKIDEPITVVQLDAHCDLRESYEGTIHSHACVAKRLLEIPNVEQILQLGIRSLCTEEATVLKEENRVKAWFAEQIHDRTYIDEFVDLVRGRKVFLTLDVDVFDPSLVPSTGTPEPSGLTFAQAESIVRLIIDEADLFAFDCVELAPIKNLHAADFLIAKFLYRLMNLRMSKP